MANEFTLRPTHFFLEPQHRSVDDRIALGIERDDADGLPLPPVGGQHDRILGHSRHSNGAHRAGGGFTLPLSHPTRTDAAMTEPYIRASELKDFAFCRRAWFLERQGVTTTLTEARALGTTDHRDRANTVRRAQTLHRTSGLLLKGVGIALALLLLAWLLHR